MTETHFVVRTCYGWGWQVLGPGITSRPRFRALWEAQKYADLRNTGFPHDQAWDAVTALREALDSGQEIRT